MDKKKQVYNVEVMALPPLRLVIGDIPSPDPDWHTSTYGTGASNQANQKTRISGRDIENTVKRIIAHLEEE